MNLKIPIVVSNVGGNSELIKYKGLNCELIEYNGIKDIEEKNIFVTSYNEHLLTLGYFLNDNNLKSNFNVNINFDQIDKINVIIPTMCLCKSCSNNKINLSETCMFCKMIIYKTFIWNINMNNITNSIINIIEKDSNSINNMINNNLDFINNHFNENIYFNQLLELFDI